MLNKLINAAGELWDTWQYYALAHANNFDPENALIISGDPRGGTTWLAHILGEMRDTALIWEPLMVSRVKEVAQLGFQWRQHIPEQDRWPEARAVIERILRGQLLSSYLCQQTSPKAVKEAEYLLIKFCRANQLLPWLTREFAFRFAPVYLVRHPCAVVASQIKQGGWDNVRPGFGIPPGKYREFYTDHAEFLSSIDSVEKSLAATWCLCNLVPFSHPENNMRWITMTYESLLLNGHAELARIEKRWNQSLPKKAYEKLMVASMTTVSASPITEGRIQEQLTHWQTQLSSRQVDNILSVLDYFKIDLYTHDPLPMRTFVD